MTVTEPPSRTTVPLRLDPVALRAELDQLALTGSGWGPLVARLAAALGRRVRLLGADGRLLVDSDRPGRGPELDFVAPTEGGVDAAVAAQAFQAELDAPVRTSDGWRASVHPIRSGPRRVALVLVGVGEDEDPVPAWAVEAASTALAIEGVRRDLQVQARAETGAWLIGELRHGSRRSAAELTEVARRTGVDLDRDHAALVLACDGRDRTMWETSLSWLRRPVQVEGTLAWTLVTGDVAADAAYVQERLAGFVSGPVRAALGQVVRGAAATRTSFAVADRALALLGAHEEPRPAVYDALDLEGLLVSVPEERLAAYVQRHLGALLTQPELLETLEAWLMTGGSRARVAERLSLHRNSVGYRLERIRSVLGVDPADPLVARELLSAFAARRALGASAAI